MTIRFARIAALAAFLAPCCGAFAQQDFSRVEIKADKLTETVWMLTGSGGNLGVSAGEDALFLIDDQYAPLAEKIRAALAKISAKPVRFVLNTHWHGDHTGGNESLGKGGAILVAHENVRRRMSTEQFVEFAGMKVKPSPLEALPLVTISADATFHVNGDEVRVIHVPRAHTDGDVIVHFPGNNVIHMGDVFMTYYPFIDTSSGGTVEGVIAAADRALALANDSTRIIPGHGTLSNKAELKAYRDMLETVSLRIRKMLRDGRKLEDIAASSVTADFDERWGKGFIKPPKFVEMITMNILRNSP